jgi:acyl CoA:acetate/3-ketoacid CoA transferase alpha subunit
VDPAPVVDVKHAVTVVGQGDVAGNAALNRDLPSCTTACAAVAARVVDVEVEPVIAHEKAKQETRRLGEYFFF